MLYIIAGYVSTKSMRVCFGPNLPKSWSTLCQPNLFFSMLLGWPHEIGPSSVDAYGLHVDTLTNAERK